MSTLSLRSKAGLILTLAASSFLASSRPAAAQTIERVNPNGSVTLTAQGGAGVSITLGGGSAYRGPTYTVPPFVPSGGPVLPPMNPVLPPMNPVYPPLGPALPPMNPVLPPMNPILPPMNTVFPPMSTVFPPMGPALPPMNPVIPSGGPVFPPMNPVIPSGGPVFPPGFYPLETPRIVITDE